VAYLQVSPQDEQTYEWFRQIFRDLANFLTLATGEPAYPRRVYGLGNDVEMRPGVVKKEVVEIFQAARRPGSPKELKFFDIVLPLPIIQAEIAGILDSWFQNAQRLRSVYDIFFGTLFNTEMYLEAHFLSLCQAMRAFIA